MCVRFKCKSTLAAALTAVGLFGTAANAALTIDLRLVSGDPKVATVAVGDTVNMSIYAFLPNANGNPADDSLQLFNASFLSTGSLLVNMTDAVTTAPWNVNASHQDTAAAGSFKITATDLDGDGDLDFGSNNNSSASNFFVPSAGQQTTGTEFLIGTLTLTVTGDAGSTSINFRPRIANSGALYRQDNVQFTGSTGQPVRGAPVVLTTAVPEPATLGLLAMGGLGLLRRARRA